MPDGASITIQVSTELNAKLEAIDSTKEELIPQALLALTRTDEEYVKEIKQALREADAGDFLTDEELAEAYQRWRS